MCRIHQIFDGFEKKYEKNMLDEKCLSLEHGKLYGYLIQLFKEKKIASIALFIVSILIVNVIGIMGKHGMLLYGKNWNIIEK